MEREVRFMTEKILLEYESNIELIRTARKIVAKLQAEKIVKRSDAWADATGTAKEKEDYVRSEVSDIDRDIANEEANIEYLYNKNRILDYKLNYE